MPDQTTAFDSRSAKEFLSSFGRRLQELRIKRGFATERALADAIGVSPQTVSIWERGRALPLVPDLVRLRQVLGVSIDELLLGDEGAER